MVQIGYLKAPKNAHDKGNLMMVFLSCLEVSNQTYCIECQKIHKYYEGKGPLRGTNDLWSEWCIEISQPYLQIKQASQSPICISPSPI